MPFAKKFQAMIDFPFVGEAMERFTVEAIDVRDEQGGPGSLHRYTVEMVLVGVGGQQGLRRALRPYVEAEPVTFSAYGNAYCLWCGRPEVESLGDGRYRVKIEAGGARIALEGELQRFLTHLQDQGALAKPLDEVAQQALLQAYLEAYRDEVRLRVNRYRNKLKRVAPRQS